VTPRAILFDLGGTLWDDYPAELAYWTYLAVELTADGRPCTLDDFTALMPECIATYCPNLSAALLYRIAGPDYRELPAVERARERIHADFDDPLRLVKLKVAYPGMRGVLEQLAGRYTLAIASQHTGRMRLWLDTFEITELFSHIELTDGGFAKPDPRFFLQCLDALGIQPAEAVMVGDRLDNDIWPANILGMASVRILSNPWRLQQPRYAVDVPGETVECLDELLTMF
jgi:putative hydrolase of the HAD superfamily